MCPFSLCADVQLLFLISNRYISCVYITRNIFVDMYLNKDAVQLAHKSVGDNGLHILLNTVVGSTIQKKNFLK